MNEQKKLQIIIVGGGAGGLELAIRLAKSRIKRKIKVTLVDDSLKYIWKPLYHEVAVGTLDYPQNEINYIDYTYQRGITFVLGRFSGINRAKKTITVSPVLDDNGNVILPSRTLSYNFLVIAVGSTSNTFNIPGVQENCYFLDRLAQAERFQKDFLYKILSFIQMNPDRDLNINIVGGGATGVELAAELKYGFIHATSYAEHATTLQKKLRICVIEAADRILPQLPSYISKKVTDLLKKKDICVLTNKKVVKADPYGVTTDSNEVIASDVIVWAAGIKAPDFLAELGIECNHLNQIVVKSTLQSISDDSIFALGDCAACQDPKTNKLIPPRAQVARQQAILLTKSIARLIADKPALEFKYKDHGSLVSLSGNVVGNLMGRVLGPFFIEGQFALFSYWSLQKLHQATLFGAWKALSLSISNLFSRRIKPTIKLH